MMGGPRTATLSLLALGSLALACDKGSDSVVVVSVEADPDVAGVAQLRATISNDGEAAVRLFPAAASAPLTLPTAFSVSFPPGRAGALDIALDGLDGAGQVVANGSGSVRIEAGRRSDGSITLRAGASLCGNGHIDPGEQCDDGDRVSSGSCDFRCAARAGAADGGTGGSDGGGEGGGGAGGSGLDAGTDAACMSELLSNRGFDDGDVGWFGLSGGGAPLIYNQGDGALVDTGVAAQSPEYFAWLGGEPLDQTWVLGQQVRIPANAVKLTARGFVVIKTNEGEPVAYDFGYVEIARGPTDVVPVMQWSNVDQTDTWAPFEMEVDATALRGATVTFQLRATTDGGAATNFFFDSLSLTATCQ